MLYQMGEVVQAGVQVEKSLHKWIEDTHLDLGTPRDERENPMALQPKIKVARKLASQLPHHSDEEKAWMRDAFIDIHEAMQLRNRVIHDQWVSFEDGRVTRFGFFAAHDGLPSAEIEPGIGPGQYSHEDWERLRTRLWHCWWRLSHFTWIHRYPPDFDYFFGEPEMHYAMIRGEFYLGRNYLVPWSWADNPPDFAAESAE